MMVINGFCFFGVEAFNAVNPDPAEHLDMISTSLPFDYFFNKNTTSGELEYIDGSIVNTTAVDSNWGVTDTSGISIASVSGLTNLAAGMLGFLNLLVSFIMSPFNLLVVTHLIDYQIALIFGAAYVMAVLLSLWQIWTGRLV